MKKLECYIYSTVLKKQSKPNKPPHLIPYNGCLSYFSPPGPAQCCSFTAHGTLHLMLDCKSSDLNCLFIGKISHATLRLQMIWDQRHNNVVPLHLIATLTDEICLSVPNSPCQGQYHNKNFIKQLCFFHITSFKGKENLGGKNV